MHELFFYGDLPLSWPPGPHNGIATKLSLGAVLALVKRRPLQEPRPALNGHRDPKLLPFTFGFITMGVWLWTLIR